MIFLHRCKKVYDGVSHAAKLYPTAYLIMIIIGTLKGMQFLIICEHFNLKFYHLVISVGNGAGFTKLAERLIRGVWTPTAMEFMQPSLWVEWIGLFFNNKIILWLKINYILYSQPYKSLYCSIHHICIRLEDRFDLCPSRFSLLRHCYFLRLFQSKHNFSWAHSTIFHSLIIHCFHASSYHHYCSVFMIHLYHLRICFVLSYSVEFGILYQKYSEAILSKKEKKQMLRRKIEAEKYLIVLYL